MEIPILKSIVILFALAVVVVFISKRLRFPAMIGYLVTGVLAGPHGLGLVTNLHDIEVLAEIGIILLLFSIGIEFSLQKLMRIKLLVFEGGFFQVAVSVVVIYLISGWFGVSGSEAWFLGMLVALSSTALVLKVIQDNGTVDSPRGRTSLAMLIFQDLAIVPMILFLPMLAGTGSGSFADVMWLVLKMVAVVVVLFVGARKIVPYSLHQIARTQSNDLFLLTLIVIAFAVAWVTSLAGLSLALGAFMAGLIISESEFDEHALGNILPFISVFTSFFFISVGMMLDVSFLIANFPMVLLVTFIVLVVKTLAGSIPVVLLGFPLRVAVMTGLTISQIGEFSFILSKMGMKEGLLSAGNYQLFLSVSVLTMAVTPLLILKAHTLAGYVLKLPWPRQLKNGLKHQPDADDVDQPSDHLIIIGYGINGHNVAQAARQASIPFRIIEMNPETVKQESAKGVPIAFGDATQPGVLTHAGVMSARVLVVTIAHPNGIRIITNLARRMNPHLHIIIRTRFIADIKPLLQSGANEVIPEEFETSIEIFSRVLAHFDVEHERINELVRDIRADSYQILRN